VGKSWEHVGTPAMSEGFDGKTIHKWWNTIAMFDEG